jgi:hypothetical protein
MSTQCSYYGRNDGKLYGYNLGQTMVDELFKEMIKKHEANLIKIQGKLISKLQKTFATEINEFNTKVSDLSARIYALEKLNKESKNAL